MTRRYLWSPDMMKPVFLDNERSEAQSHTNPQTEERCYAVPTIFAGRRQFESMWICPDCHRQIHYPSPPGGWSPNMQTVD